jgi:hypothetical protein
VRRILHVNCNLFLFEFITKVTVVRRQLLVKLENTKFHEILLNGSRVATCRKTEAESEHFVSLTANALRTVEACINSPMTK